VSEISFRVQRGRRPCASDHRRGKTRLRQAVGWLYKPLGGRILHGIPGTRDDSTRPCERGSDSCKQEPSSFRNQRCEPAIRDPTAAGRECLDVLRASGLRNNLLARAEASGLDTVIGEAGSKGVWRKKSKRLSSRVALPRRPHMSYDEAPRRSLANPKRGSSIRYGPRRSPRMRFA